MLHHNLHVVPDLLLLVASVFIQLQLSYWIFTLPDWRSLSRRALLAGGNLLLAGLFMASYLLGFQRSWWYLPSAWGQWIEAAGLICSIGLIGLYLGILAWRASARFQPPRRRFFQAMGASLVVAPYVATTIGIITRDRFHVKEVDVHIRNLPRDLEGLRLVQVTDIHLSAFLSEKAFARAIDMANETRAHIALVTGDLISRAGDPLDACLRQLARLRADAGVLGCLGNHEIYTNTEDYVTQQGKRIGIEFLRNQSRLLRFGNAAINFAGVDYQKMHQPYLTGADALIVPGCTNVLLSHNPDVFPVAASQGYDLTIAGHTHGGQVNFEILHQDLNVARYYTAFVRGMYRLGNRAIWVGSGLGTIGVPVRLGAPPEIAVVRLCAS
jgi:uncharacterized protein